MKGKQNFVWSGRQLALVLMQVALVCALVPVGSLTQANTSPTASNEWGEPPVWWYDPDEPAPRETAQAIGPPEWWYAPRQGVRPLTTVPGFTEINVNVGLAASQSMNAGAIPLDIAVVADGITPEVVVQVLSNDVPHKAVYAGYERTPDGAVQNLGGFQQARFLGGVGTSNRADVQFKYEAVSPGWVVFTIQVWVGGYMYYGPQERAIYINPVPPDFTSLNTSVSLPGSQSTNAGTIPLDIAVTADGPTPEIVVQVVSADVPERAVYAAYTKTPDGAIQNQGGFQQARFVGGVGPGHTAEVQFEYESLVSGWLAFEVQVWAGGNRIYGPQEHAIFISPVSPAFSSLDTSVSLMGSQGMNAGLIPLDVEVVADGPTPEIVVEVISADVPERAVYAGHVKSPAGAIQNLGGNQRARFVGGVGPDNRAAIQFQYECIRTGWVIFTVQVRIGDYMWYGPQEHAIYVRSTGLPSLNFPPRIVGFDVGAQQSNQARFDADIPALPAPRYDLDCGSSYANAVLKDLTCYYHTQGEFVATLWASNYVDGVKYTDVATTAVTISGTLTFLKPRFIQTGVVTWTGTLTRTDAEGKVVTRSVVLLEPVAIPTGTLPITVTYRPIKGSKVEVYEEGGSVTFGPETSPAWEAIATNHVGSTSFAPVAARQYALYLPPVLRDD
jgi:hypothetical protein